MDRNKDTRIYYKGRLVIVNEKEKSNGVRLIARYDYKKRRMIIENEELFTKSEISTLTRYLNALLKSCYVTRKDIKDMLNKLFESKHSLEKFDLELIDMPIIFEKTDDLGIEMHTKVSFPILNNNSLETTYEIYFDDNVENKESEYRVEEKDLVRIKGVKKLKIALVVERLATKEEIDEYRSMFGIFNTKKKKLRYQEKLQSFRDMNEYESVVRKDEELIKKDNVLALMEIIEYKLEILKERNNNLYLEVLKEYNEFKEIHKQNKKLGIDEKVEIESLKCILNELEVIETFNLDYKTDILGYISRVKEMYINKLLNNEDINNFNVIEGIAELFYKQQGSYSIMEKRTAEIDLGYIYLIEIYKNKDKLDLYDLEHSYFSYLYKTIVLCILGFKNQGLIDIDINLSSNIGTRDVVNYIKNMKIKNKVKGL